MVRGPESSLPPEKCPNCGARRIGVVERKVYFVCGGMSEAGLPVDQCDLNRHRYFINEEKVLASDKLFDSFVASEYEGWTEVQQPAFQTFKRIHTIV